MQFSGETLIFNIAQVEVLPVTVQQIQRATHYDPVLSKVFMFTKRGWPARTQEVLKQFSKRQQELMVERGWLMWGIRFIVPKKLQSKISDELHCKHPRIFWMKALARSYLWWPGLDKDMEAVAKSCLSCQSVKQAPAVAPLHPWLWRTTPWQCVHVDFLGTFQGKMFMVAVDAYLKWPKI